MNSQAMSSKGFGGKPVSKKGSSQALSAMSSKGFNKK